MALSLETWQLLPYFSFAVLYAIFAAFLAIKVFDAFKTYRKSKEEQTETDKFYKLTFELMKLYDDIDIMIPHILRIFKQTSGISDINPNFFYFLIDHLQKLEVKIIEKDSNLGIAANIEPEEHEIYLNMIHDIITTIETDHPFSGLNEDELSSFEQLKREIESGNIENASLRLVDLSKRIKAKNIDIAKLNKKANSADFYSKLSVVLTILSIIEGAWVLFF